MKPNIVFIHNFKPQGPRCFQNISPRSCYVYACQYFKQKETCLFEKWLAVHLSWMEFRVPSSIHIAFPSPSHIVCSLQLSAHTGRGGMLSAASWRSEAIQRWVMMSVGWLLLISQNGGHPKKRDFNGENDDKP